MQTSAFKTILEELEMNGDLLSGSDPSDGLSQLEMMTTSVFGPAKSKGDGSGNLWTAANGAYADHDYEYVRNSMPVLTKVKHPSGLAELKEKLRHELSVGELNDLRRKFAFDHHPDRLPTTDRDAATSRLATANDLIDLAIQNTGQRFTS